MPNQKRARAGQRAGTGRTEGRGPPRRGRSNRRMTTIASAAAQYRRAGWRLAALHPRDKRPIGTGWEQRSVEPDAFRTSPQPNVGVVLGGGSRGLIDLDLDTPEAVAVAGQFLGDHVWPAFGRASSRASHYLVQVTGLDDSFTRRALRARAVPDGPKGGAMVVEVRGNRHQTMFPPSVHPSGDVVEWEPDWRDLRNVLDALEAQSQPLEQVIELAERIYALALVAAAWPAKGSRHDAAVALAGWMAHSGWSENLARQSMTAVCHAAGDEERGDRLTAVGSSYSRVAQGQRVQGYATLLSLLGEQAFPPAGAVQVCTLTPQPSVLNERAGESRDPQSDTHSGAESGGSSKNQASQLDDTAREEPPVGSSTPPKVSEDDPRAAFLRYSDAYQAFLHEAGARLVWFEDEFWDYSGGTFSVVNRGRIRAELRRTVAPNAAPSTLGNVLAVLEDRLTIGSGRAALADPPLDLRNGAALAGGPYLVFTNGSVDLGTNPRLLFDHNPDQFHTRRIPHRFPEGGEQCPVWMQCLRDWFGEEDQATPRMLAQWFGYVLSGDLSHERILAVKGAADAGKSTLAWVLEQLVGPDTVVPSSLSSIAGRFGLQSFQGKALAIFAEARTAARIDHSLGAGRILAISGRDVVEVEKKNRDAIAVRLPTRLMFVSNKLPSIGDDTGAFHRRLLVVSFNRSLERRDVGLRSKLAEELPGILRWSLRGLEDLRLTGGFAETMASQVERQEDLAGLSPMRAWASEELRFDQRCTTETAKLRASFEDWSLRNGLDTLTAHAFSRQFRDTFGLQPDRARGHRVFKGVCLGG